MARSRPHHIPVARGDLVTVDVQGLGDGADGLGRVDDYIVFVAGVLPGERATVEITSAARKFGRGELRTLRRRSPDRVEPRCAHFLDCGGCHLQHLAYPAQLREKRDRLVRLLTDRTTGQTPPVADTVAPPDAYGQRHKVVLHMIQRDGDLQPALHRARSLERVPVAQCPASEPMALALAMRTVELLGTLHHRAWDPVSAPEAILRSVLVRRATSGEAHVVIVVRTERLPFVERIVAALHAAGATTISVNHNPGEPSRLLGPDTTVISGPGRIVERLGPYTFPLSPTSFFQTAPAIAWQMAQRVVQWLAPERRDTVADLYCGAGLLTLPLAERAGHTLGVEVHGAAIADARAAAAANAIGGIEWHTGRVDGVLAQCVRGALPRPDLVAVDPPREGLDEYTIERLVRLRPRRVAYVSCEPQSLRRDLLALAAAGYRVREVVPFDMFPQTSHVEAVACLERDG